MIFVSHKDESIREVETNIEKITTGFNSLKGDYKFKKILEVGLALGNYLNGQSFKGGASAFKI